MYASPGERAISALAALALVLGAVAALVLGLRPGWQTAVRSALVAVDLPPAPPPPKPRASPLPAKPAPASAPVGDPGARNRRNTATPVFAPPITPMLPPPPLTAAPLPNAGTAPNTGASLLPGPGQGAGSEGAGLGGGGTGGTGSGLAVREPRQIRGRLSYDDLPQGLIQPGQEAAVEVRYTVNPDGTASACRIDRSSGFPALDATACRLIEQRFRFRPARDRAGRAVPATIAEEHRWIARAAD